MLSQILEVASLNETGRIAEEILNYLQSTMSLSSIPTVQCVRQLLKSLFGTNLIAKWTDVCKASFKIENRDDGNMQEDVFDRAVDECSKKSFYEQCFQRPAKQMNNIIKSMGNSCETIDESDSIGRR